jgi:hypothetical protein
VAQTGAAQGAQGGGDTATDSAPTPAPAAAAAQTERRSRKWVSAVSSKFSTKWIGGIATALILASTAAFGGLAPVPQPPLPELAAGETFTGAGMEMTPKRTVLIDELSETGVVPGDGERLLVIIIDVTNIDDDARLSTADGGIGEVRVEGAPDVKPGVVRYDDTTLTPWLQPDVPAELVLAWAVPESAFADGDDARIALHTATKTTGAYVVYGDYWTDIEVAAHATVPIEDVGAGISE